MRLSDQPLASSSRHIAGRWPILASLFRQNFQHSGNGLADVVLEFIDRLPLRIATWEGWNLCPKSAFRVFVDDNSAALQALIFSQRPTRRLDAESPVKRRRSADSTGACEGTDR